jgi:AcrR family transcriptional regulator
MAAVARVRTAEAPQTRSRLRVADEVSKRSSEQVVDIQRARLRAAAVRAVDELGYTGTTVAHITGRARVSRRTFYELFQNREECLASALEGAVQRVRQQLEQADLTALPWRERMRMGLWTILCFLDREPALARFFVVQSARGGQRMLERREQHLGELAAAIDEGRGEGVRGEDAPALTAEGLVGAAMSIVYGRLLRRDSRPLVELQGELMGMIVLPYMGPAVARREQTRPAPVSVIPVASASIQQLPEADGDPLQGVPMRFTYRTARVLEAVATAPGVSNRLVGERAGITDQGQISKLLTRLERLGLLENTGVGHAKGEPNAWQLTQTGQSVARRIGAYTESFRSPGESE